MIGQFTEDTVQVFAAELGCALGAYECLMQTVHVSNLSLTQMTHILFFMFFFFLKDSSMILASSTGMLR